jgi:glycosyltransferase involved in cell wall biosynthesis
MRIGLVPVLDNTSGGVYQYSLNVLQALLDWSMNGGEDSVVVFTEQVRCPALDPLPPTWTVRPLMAPWLEWRALRALRRLTGTEDDRRWTWLAAPPTAASPSARDPEVRFRPSASRWFHRFGIDLMLYPVPNALAFETGLPYVMAIHDLQHRLQPEFPEVSAGGQREAREYLHHMGARHAMLLIADSEVGQEDIVDAYGADGVAADRVRILPLLGSPLVAREVSEPDRRRVREAYRLPERFVFYPAQFWAHKNHARIVEALGLLRREHGLRIAAVFCGAATDAPRTTTFRELEALVRRLGLEEDVRFLGYVPDGDVAPLYAEAVALVMPTFFGPTNMPVLEAWGLGCPVLTSDIRGIREHVGDAAVLVEPRSVEEIATGMLKLWTDEGLRGLMAEKGRRRLERHSPAEFRRRLVEIVEEAKRRVRVAG